METQLNSYFPHNKEAEWITTHLIQKQELMNSKTPVNHALFFKYLQNNPSSARYSITNFALLPPEDEYGEPFQDLQKSWEIDYQNNYVGFTEYGTQIPLEEALKILDRTMEHHEPDITRELGKNDVISCGLDKTVFVNGKTRPHINRLIDFKERYPEHLQKIIEEGYDFRRDGCSIAPAWFSQRNYIGPKKEFLDKELTAWRHMEYLKPYDKIIREKFGPPVVISALHVADDGKMRLVDDLRYTNLMDHTGHVEYEKFSDYIQLISRSELLCKTDVRSGYMHIRMKPDTAPYLCIIWNGIIYYLAGLPFGIRSAPQLFEKFMYPIRIEVRKFIKAMIGYIDDASALLGKSLNEAQSIQCHLINVFISFGWLLGADKVAGPTSQLELLGYRINTENMTVKLSERRESKILILLTKVSRTSCKSISLKRLAKLLGSIATANMAISLARQICAPWIDILREAYPVLNWNLKVDWTDNARDAANLLNSNWATLHGRAIQKPMVQQSLVADATPERISVYTVKGSFPVFSARKEVVSIIHTEQYEDEIAANELKAHLIGLNQFGDRLASSAINFWTDNKTAASYIKKGGGHSKLLAKIAWAITLKLFELKIFYTNVKWIPSKLNSVADLASRFPLASPKLCPIFSKKLQKLLNVKRNYYKAPLPTHYWPSKGDNHDSITKSWFDKNEILAQATAVDLIGINTCSVIQVNALTITEPIIKWITTHSICAYVITPYLRAATWWNIMQLATWTFTIHSNTAIPQPQLISFFTNITQ